jgi:hypothetical protein
MGFVRSAVQDPLVHFLAAGAVVFAILSAASPPEAPKRVVVDRAALLDFIQYRSKAFEPTAAAALFDGMDEGAKERLIADYVEEEALAREAKALGLDGDDYVIRQRLIQKLNFLAEASAGDAEPSAGEIAAFYEAHRDEYVIPASATFTHVFFNAETRGEDAARKAAIEAADRLNRTRARFEDAIGQGDRFAFQANYVERTFDSVAVEFGETATRDVFSGATGVWRAPVTSPYGAHAVFVAKIEPERIPALAEIAERVAEDAAREAKSATVRRLIEDTIAEYDVVVAPDLR